jgi:hypothetical protein
VPLVVVVDADIVLSCFAVFDLPRSRSSTAPTRR